MSLLVFKEGEIINLVRVIENEDGSYSPYSKEKSSNEASSSKTESHMSFFKKISEDMDMAIKMQMLKLKLKNMSLKKEMRQRKRQENVKESLQKLEEYECYEKDITNLLSYLETRKQLSTKKLDKANRKTFPKNSDEADSEDEHGYSEIALKDKHRTKLSLSNFSQRLKSLHENCEKRSRSDSFKIDDGTDLGNEIAPDSILCKNISERLIKPSGSRSYQPKFEQQTALPESFSIIKEHADNENVSIEVPCSESLSLSARAELGRIHISDDAESIELEDSPPDLWHIHQTETLKHNKGFNVGLIAKHIGLEHNYNIKNAGDGNEILNNDFFENDFYNLSHYVSPPASVPYMSKENANCDTFFDVGKSKSYNRLPLYGRQAKLNSGNGSRDLDDYSTFFNLKETEHRINYLQEIKTLENKYEREIANANTEESPLENEADANKTKGGSSAPEDKPSEISKHEESLGAISKKTMRCGHCKKRLTIVNIYNCRCGKIFCGQHRYSETHNCKYDYKSEGKKLIEQANPLVVAKKLDKI